jgi:hypothetical protein
MAVKTKIPMEKILTLKKRLQRLPAKDTGKSREEAAELLAAEYREALDKGYSSKELRAVFMEEGVTVSAELLKRKIADVAVPARQENAQETDLKNEQEKAPEITRKIDQETGHGMPQEISKKTVGEIAATALEKSGRADPIPAHKIIVKPDTPKDEL